MRIKRTYLVTGGLIAAVLCSPAVAQEVSAQANTDTTAAEQSDDDVVIVKGLRKSLQTAVDRKRRSAQIVDSVDAEDAGKLPDNNVNEAIARITGVQIERERGEGSGLKIRGMEDVQTTLNGSPNYTGVGRAASLNDIPAELLKSVQVFKNRTADQVEGGIAGTVNVDLRRPLDLPKGWTFAGSVRNVYANVGDTESPYASALVAKRFDTPVGEMGFLLNYSYQKNNYNEQWVTSESPATFWFREEMSLTPAVAQNTIAPYRVQNGIQHGETERNAYNLGFQWRPNTNWTLLLEASGFDVDEVRSTDFLDARVKDGPIGVALSNLVYQPDGITLKSLTVTDTILTDNELLPVGPFARDTLYTARNSRINAEANYRNDRWAVNFGMYRDENSHDEDWYQQMLRMNGLASVKYDFDAEGMAEDAPNVSFFNASGTAIDFTNPDNYYMNEIENGKAHSSSKETVYFFDANYRVSDDKFIRNVQVGARKTQRDVERNYGYRYARFAGTRSIKLEDFPGGDSLSTIYADVPGFDGTRWLRLSADSYMSNFDAIRGLASDPTKLTSGGGGMWDPVTGAVPAHIQWQSKEVPTERMMGSYSSQENTTAMFAQAFYGFDLFNIPVDGVVGGRWIHTWGDSFSYARVINWIDHDSNPATPNIIGTPDQLMVPMPNDVDYDDFIPSAHAIVHFTPKLQFRMAYSKNVQRPGFEQASSFTFLDRGTGGGVGGGWGGNADLKANREDNYDASLEYYFGRGGVVSFAAYLKKPDGFIYDNQESEIIDGQEYLIWRPRNASEGLFQGYEFNAQGFFDFLPGRLKNFGGQFNYSYNQIAKIDYGGVDNNANGNSKYTYNLILYYDTPQFNARIAYNYRDRFRAWNYMTNVPGMGFTDTYSPYIEATSRLDAAVNWTPIKQLTLALEGTNLLENNTQMYFGRDKLLPQGMRVQARTIQLSARFRY